MHPVKIMKPNILALCCLSVVIGLACVFSGCQKETKTTLKIQSPAGKDKNNTTKPKSSPFNKTIDMGNDVKMEFVLIPDGEFDMGSPESEKDRLPNEGPVHKVKISRSFYMSKYEVTQEQYMTLTGTNPSRFSGIKQPVEDVNWIEAVAFCNLMSEKLSGKFRLPTEAEWEYASRAGTQTAFSYGDDANYSRLVDYCWYDKNGLKTTHPVGQKKSNLFMLYDMYGNVAEWCSDWYDGAYYQSSPAVDPNGPLDGTERVYRGGSWINIASTCRSAHRLSLTPGNQSPYIGFRIVMNVD
jgi:formylglycine-generating enzyme required for sulfatase activity